MGERRGAHTVLVGKPKECGHLEDLGADGKIILHESSRNGTGGVDWIDLAQDRVK
jgi:hypothetical protein